MAPKRGSNEWDSDEPESSKRQRRVTCSDLIRGWGVTFEELQLFIEPNIREMVREVLEKKIHASSPSQSYDETKRDWMLRFVNQPPLELFTYNKVEVRGGALLQVEVVDVITKTVVLAGPISSLKLEIVALPGDFDPNQQKDFGEKYFDSSVVNARKGTKPLIIGEVRTFLKNGVGPICNVRFTDNSRCTKSGKFRLGVRVIRGSCKDYRVIEAVSNAFKVRDRRGEASMKHSCPSLTDEVWRLKMIAPNGKYHQRLESIGIKTVGDFLQKLQADPSTLKETLNLKCGRSNKIWNTIVEHAQSHEKEQYEAARNVSPKMADIADGVPKIFPHNFQLQQVADDLEGYTYNDTNQLPVDVAATYSSADLQSEPFIHPNLPLPCVDIQGIRSGQQGHAFSPFMPSSSNYHEKENQMEFFFPNAALSDLHQSPWTGMTDEEFPQCFMNYPSEMLVQATDNHTPENPIIQPEPANWYPCSPLLWRQLSPNFYADMGLISSLVPNNATPRTSWCKLWAAVIWRIRVMRQRKLHLVRTDATY